MLPIRTARLGPRSALVFDFDPEAIARAYLDADDERPATLP